MAFAADAEGYINRYGVSMAVSSFHRLSHANCRVSSKRKVLAQQHVTTRGRKDLACAKTAAPRTRGSVRRASGFVQIAVALKTLMFGEQSDSQKEGWF